MQSRNEFQDLFNVFDVTGMGKISYCDLGKLLRLVPIPIENNQLVKIAASVTADKLVNFEQAMEIANRARLASRPLSPPELAQALRIICVDGQMVDIAYIKHLKRVLTSTGLDGSALSRISSRGICEEVVWRLMSFLWWEFSWFLQYTV